MPINHNPASAGTSYCDNGGKWFLNNNEVAAFQSSSYFTKEDLQAGKKIVWDNNQEYFINNPNNYSYEIIFKNMLAYRIWYYWNPNNIRQVLWRQNSRTDIPTGKNISYFTFMRGEGSQTGQFSNNTTGFRVYWSDGTFTQLENWGENIYPSWWEILPVDPVYGGPGEYNIKISDGTEINYYLITNTNSVQVIDILANNAKFKFFNNGTFTEITAHKNSLVSVACNCPENTIDCGDCCLDCESVSSQLTTIRKSIINL